MRRHWNHSAGIKLKYNFSCISSYTFIKWTQRPLYPLMSLCTSVQHSATYQRPGMWRKATWVVSSTLQVIITSFRLLCGSSFLQPRIIDAMSCISTTNGAEDNRWYFSRISCCQWNCGVPETVVQREQCESVGCCSAFPAYLLVCLKVTFCNRF